MAIKQLITISAIGVAMGIMSSVAIAGSHGDMVPNYVKNPYGEVLKNSYGECWRDSWADTDEKLEECGYEKMGVKEVIVTDDVKEVVVTEAPPPCPEIIVLKNLHFDFDSTMIHEEDKARLEEARDFIRMEVPEGCHKTEDVAIIGHTDSTGPEDYNQGLSERRAQAVADYLRSIGVEASLVVSGMGESEPVADNSTKEGRAENRRVVIDINTSN